MTICKIVHRIKEDHYLECNKWQKQFIDDIYDGILGLSSNTDDLEITEYLTKKQTEKIEEMAEELGIV